MKSYTKITLLSILFTSVFLSSMAGYIFGFTSSKKYLSETPRSSLPPQQSVSADVSSESASPVPETKKRAPYILREHNEKLALFSYSEDVGERLWQTYDILVKSLPEADRLQLRKGIEFSSMSGALSAIEDFSS